MSSTGKVVLWALVIIIIALGAWWLFGSASSAGAPAAATQTGSGEPAAAAAGSGLPTASSDSSDAALAQDSAAISTQMSGLGSDNTATDQSFNDQAGTQSY